MLSNSDSLKRFLLHLPANSQFNFSNDSKKDIRKALFWALSGQGEYLDWIFPLAFKEGNKLSEAVDNIDKYGWSLKEFEKQSFDHKSSDQVVHDHSAFHGKLPCARIFRKGEPIYRCLSCGYDETCALCSYCYKEESHKNHKVHITICQRENGGVCDCGDPEAWVQDYDCPFSSGDTDLEGTRKTPPKAFQESFLETLEIILDYFIDVMSLSNMHFQDSSTMDVNKIHTNTFLSCLNSKKYGYPESNGEETLDRNSGKYFLMLYNDQIRHYRDAVQRIYLASSKVPEFAVMVADKVQSFGKAKVISSKDISLLIERQQILASTGLATCIRSHRDVFREEMVDEMMLWLYDLTESDIFKSHIEFRDLICLAYCKRWRNGLLHCSRQPDLNYTYKTGTLDASLKIPKLPTDKKDESQVNSNHWKFSPSMWNLPRDICEKCEYNLDESDYDPNTTHLGSRFQYFCYLDISFWKSMRNVIQNMFSTSLITNLTYKHVICSQYVDMYPVLADMFLTLDREPELNIMCTLSTQLFTCPSNSTEIVAHGDLARIFASIYSFLTVEEIREPVNIELTHEISMKSLKNRRWGQIFFDIGYILSRSKDASAILNSGLIPMSCDILALFQGRPVMKREAKIHIEYENSDYTAFFHAILVIYQFAEHIALCIKKTTSTSPEEIKEISIAVIKYVIQFLLKLENNEYPGLIDEFVDIHLDDNRKTTRELTEGSVIQSYSIDKEKVSFLHPIHSFLSWLIEHISLDSPSELKKIFTEAEDEFSFNNSQLTPSILSTTIFEYPIRTIVLMSQIKSGFWVRNGFSVRSQLQLYKNTGLRESGYLRDMFLIQTFINSNSPNLVCFLLFNRWLLMDGFIKIDGTGENSEPVYDHQTLPYMIEECIMSFIHLLNEDLYLRDLTTEEINETRVRLEILHNICFGPTSYTKLCMQIPDHIQCDKKFDMILEELTTFTPPTGSNDLGIYELKEEYFDQINPYYFNYSANTKEDAIKLLKERIHKKTGKPISSIAISPKIRKAEELGSFRYIGNFAVSSYFGKFVINTLNYILKEEVEKYESLLETLLHLLHICSYEEMIDIKTYGNFYNIFINKDENNVSMASLLYKLLQDEKAMNFHAKIKAIFNKLEEKYGTLVQTMNRDFPEFTHTTLKVETIQAAEKTNFERKKRLAKDRQRRLMEKFKKQQTSFLEQNTMEDTDSDTDMNENEESLGWKFPDPHCLLCQNAAENAGPFGIICYFTKSSEFRSVPFDDEYWTLKAFSDNANLNIDEEDSQLEKSNGWYSYMKHIQDDHVFGPGFNSHQDVSLEVVSQSCAHGMHYQCYMNYLNSNRNKVNQITRNNPERNEHKEFLCPLCKSINNVFIPILWNSNNRNLEQFLKIENTDVFKTFSKEKLSNPDWMTNFVKAAETDIISSSSNLTSSAIELIEKYISPHHDTDSSYVETLLSDTSHTIASLYFPVDNMGFTNILVSSIKSVEISLRGISSKGNLIISQISNNSLINLRAINEWKIASFYIKLKHEHSGKSDPTLILNILSKLLFLSSDNLNESILERDFFEILVTCFPLPTAGFNFNEILKNCFLSHVIQSFHIIATEIVNKDFFTEGSYTLFDIPKLNGLNHDLSALITRIFKSLSRCNDEFDDIVEDPEFGEVVFSMLLKPVTTFLRQAAIYSFIVCPNIENLKLMESNSEDLEANVLCKFLNLPPLDIILNRLIETSSQENRVYESFLNHINSSIIKSEPIDLRKKLEYPGVISLCKLPERLDFFFTGFYYSDVFDTPHSKIENPAICLFCGDVLDVQKTALGSKQGQCTTHFMMECHNSVGIFLFPKERCLLLMHKNGGAFFNAPFLDQHGELATDSKRHEALYLMEPRYKDFIRSVWLQHDIPNVITRKLDSVMDAGGWDTL